MEKVLFIVVLTLLFVGCSRSDDNSPRLSPTDAAQHETPGGATGTGGDTNPDANAAGYSEDNLEDIGRDFKRLMENLGIPGAQLAITRNEKLVYLASLGIASKATNTPVTKSSLFRIASISKPITLLAISRLISNKKLHSDDRVFGPGSLLGTTYGSTGYDTRELEITVQHLVDHTSGFSNNPYDIMFDDLSLSQSDLINRVLDERTPEYEPGTRYEYSNFGYCLLGRIIEKVTGTNYEAYVQQELLYPMDISQMSIARNTPGEAYQNEVSYYSSWFSPYLLNVARMDSHGGWVASAQDLAKFAVHVDTRQGVPDILPKDAALAYLQTGNWNHNGALPGTIAVLEVNYPITFVVLLNKGETNFYDVIQVVRNFMHDKINGRTAWPKHDLFVNY